MGAARSAQRVICVGDIMTDVLAVLPRGLAVGSDTPAPVALTGGGSAANTAAWLAAVGVRATLVARVGADALGRAALDELARAGVELAVSVDPELPTGTCIVLVDASGERTMIPSAGANAVGGAVPELGAGDHVHLSAYALFHPIAHDRALTTLLAARAAGCPVSVDAASSALLLAFGPERFLASIGSALLLANGDEATALTGSREPRVAAALLGARTGSAVVKCGVEGAIWSDGRAVVHEPTGPVTPLDTTGAGDAFAAGLLAQRVRGATVAVALRAGNSLAAHAIGQRGARPSALIDQIVPGQA